MIYLILCNCRLPLRESFFSHICLASLALHPEVIEQWAGCSGWKPDLQYKLNSFYSALWPHRHPRAECGNAWGWWEGRSSQQWVVVRAGRNAGETSLLIAGYTYSFPSGTTASSNDPSKDFVPWGQTCCKTHILTWCCKWNQALNSTLYFRQEFYVNIWSLFRAAQQATTIFFLLF